LTWPTAGENEASDKLRGMQGLWRWVWLAGGLLTIGSVGWPVVQLTLLAPNDRSNAISYWQFMVGVAVGPALTVIGLIKDELKPAPEPSLDKTTEKLAKVMWTQWEDEAIVRRLVGPATRLPICWCRTALPVVGPIGTVIESDEFDPLPGLDRVTNDRLDHGTDDDLHGIYGGLGSGRLVIIGPSGSGKSAAAILLLLDALRFRKKTSDDAERQRIPVPVLFTLYDWNPKKSIDDWIVGKLIEISPFRGIGGAKRAKQLLNDRRIAVFLDGFDEINENSRNAVLEKLSASARFRLVLFTRSEELLANTEKAILVGAVALKLQPVERTAAAKYLLQFVADPPRKRWKEIADALISDRDSKLPLSQALDNPLSITLLRDAYPPDGLVNKLLDSTQYPTRDDIENHLLDHTVDAAYTPRPDQPPLRWQAEDVKRWLRFLARHLRDNCEGRSGLAWWELRYATPARLPQIVVGVTCGIISGLAAMLGTHVGIGIGIGLGAGILVGLAVAHIQIRSTTRFKYGDPARGIGGGLVGAVLGGACAGLAGKLGLGYAPWPFGGLAVALGVGIAVGPRAGFVRGLRGSLAGGFLAGCLSGVGKGFAAALVNTLGVGLATGLIVEATGRQDPASPPRRSPIGFVGGLAIGVAVYTCLLFTSDAADDLLCVVFGG